MPVDPSELARVLAGQNPWHQDGKVPEDLAPPVERALAQGLWRNLLPGSQDRFHLILGPRRVGKTTVMYQTVRRLLQEGIPPRRLWWLRLDHPILLETSLGDLAQFVRSQSQATAEQPAFLFLDELVYAESWDLWLKTFHDERWPLRILATSSAAAALKERAIESGVGRWLEYHLSTYTLKEFLDLVKVATGVQAGQTLHESLNSLQGSLAPMEEIRAWRGWILRIGGFPEFLKLIVGNPETEGRFDHRVGNILRTDAIERALYKDIPQAFGVQNPIMLERVLYILAGQIGGVLSPRNICNDLDGFSVPTFERYLAFLERSYLIFTLPNYSGSEREIQKRGRKVYFSDGAVRNAALQRGQDTLLEPGEQGALLENLVASHLRTLALHTGVRLHYWRARQDREVDFIYDHPEKPVAIEVGASSTHTRAGLAALRARDPRFRESAWLCAPGLPLVKPVAAADGIGLIPLDLALLVIGAQAEKAQGLTLA